ncbi:hypothetical protein ETAR_23180 [Edwardsiella tarda]
MKTMSIGRLASPRRNDNNKYNLLYATNNITSVAGALHKITPGTFSVRTARLRLEFYRIAYS